MTEFKKETRFSENQKGVYAPFLYAILLAMGIFFGYMISLNTANKTAIGTKVESDKMKTILNYVQNKYVDTLDTRKLEEEVISDMLSDLDPHSFYIPPTDIKNINDDMRGDFEGIGVEFYIVNDTVTIVNALAGGPSEELGVMSGDKIYAVNDSVIAGVGVQNKDVVKLLKGPKGTQVKVSMLRHTEKIDFNITRAKIPLQSVDIAYMLKDNIGLIKINKFSGTTYDEFYNSLRSLKRQGLENLIIDLRGNGGGYLRTAVEIADELLAGKKLVVYTEGAHFAKRDYSINRPGEFEQGRVVILVDENSASASEILSGALQDWDRALIIGRRTFGKGLVQEQYAMPDNSALRLTVARYYIPSGRSIQKPYEDKENYHKEVYKRYENGEFFKDSIYSDTIVYYTKIKKRKVYGGGGINPDIFVPFDTLANNLYANKLRVHVPEFVYNYYSNHSHNFKQYNSVSSFKQNFQVSDELFERFLSYAESKKWKRDMTKMTKNKIHLKRFLKAFFAKQLFQNDGYFSIVFDTDPVIKEAIEQIENQFVIE